MRASARYLRTSPRKVRLVADRRPGRDALHAEAGLRLVEGRPRAAPDDLAAHPARALGRSAEHLAQGDDRALGGHQGRLQEGAGRADVRRDRAVLVAGGEEIGEGSKVRTPWLHDFLDDPSSRIRPWLEIRMPSFDLTEEQMDRERGVVPGRAPV